MLRGGYIHGRFRRVGGTGEADSCPPESLARSPRSFSSHRGTKAQRGGGLKTAVVPSIHKNDHLSRKKSCRNASIWIDGVTRHPESRSSSHFLRPRKRRNDESCALSFLRRFSAERSGFSTAPIPVVPPVNPLFQTLCLLSAALPVAAGLFNLDNSGLAGTSVRFEALEHFCGILCKHNMDALFGLAIHDVDHWEFLSRRTTSPEGQVMVVKDKRRR